MVQLAWYLKRLRVMSGREILHRLGQQTALALLLARYRMGARPLASLPAPTRTRFGFCTARQRQLPALNFDAAALREAAPALLRGQVPTFGRDWQWRPAPGIWHRAPDSGRTWPRQFFAGIAYRQGNPFGDVRQLWEPARLQHLVELAWIARTGTPDQRARSVAMINAQLTSWVADNPPMIGAHYISAMECALRLLAVCHALDMIRDRIPDAAPWRALETIVESHAPLIARRLSLHSSTGNHTTAEAAGLVYAGLLFPELRGAQRWLSTGLSILTGVAEHQILPDGGGAEQALHYHRFNLQLLALVRVLLNHHGRGVPPAITDALARGNAFLAVMGLAEGRLAAIGDSDDGHALSRYLLLPACTNTAMPDACIFDHAGYTVARIGSRPTLRLTFDHGPLGMPPSCGHGHADALAVLLSAGNDDVLVDTGTYTYTGDQQWRRYFRGTRAHNTVTVDDEDQARQEACFLWSRPFRTRVLAWEIQGAARGRLIAEHDGYRHKGVCHARGIAWLSGQWLLIHDMLIGDGRHRLELNWHLGKQPIWRAEGIFELQAAGETLEFHCAGGTISTHGGESDPLTGWRSPAYGVVEPITTVSLLHDGPLPHTYTTLIRLPGSSRLDDAIEDALTWMTDHSHRDRDA
ncbi:MAG: alginate lyase family protein [Aquisalimonadaceae bacterium]